MQTTLTFTHDKKKYVSKQFDFETACLINDRHAQNMSAEIPDKVGILRMCMDGVVHMFDGTEATQDVIDSLPVKTKAALCGTLFNIYMEECFSKNE